MATIFLRDPLGTVKSEELLLMGRGEVSLAKENDLLSGFIIAVGP